MAFDLEPQRKFIHNTMCMDHNFSTGSVERIFSELSPHLVSPHSTGAVDKILSKFPHSYFLVFAQESIKEGAIGEALCAELPLVKSALSYVPHPAALGFRWSNLTSILCQVKMFRFFLGSKVQYKIEMRYRGIVSARRNILKGRN